MRLRRDGHLPLPQDYDFRLIPIEDEEQMRKNIIYIARNASQVTNIRPGCYLFGSTFSFHSQVARLVETVRAGNVPVRKLRKIFNTILTIPPDRLIHSGLEMAMPQGFVDTSVLYKVFPSATEFETRLVKDYEAFVEIADKVGEEFVFSVEEVRNIVDMELMKTGQRLSDLSSDSKCRLAVQLNRQFRLDTVTISQALFIPARVISQVLRSKRYK